MQIYGSLNIQQNEADILIGYIRCIFRGESLSNWSIPDYLRSLRFCLIKHLTKLIKQCPVSCPLESYSLILWVLTKRAGELILELLSFLWATNLFQQCCPCLKYFWNSLEIAFIVNLREAPPLNNPVLFTYYTNSTTVGHKRLFSNIEVNLSATGTTAEVPSVWLCQIAMSSCWPNTIWEDRTTIKCHPE